MNNIIRALAGIAALLGTTLAQAVHLGDLRTSSALGESYTAVIPLYAPAPDELTGAAVKVIGDPVLLRQPGMRRILESMSGEIVEGAAGAYIRVRSSVAVNELILAFRVELATGSRSVSRTYSAIIDPPPATVESRSRSVAPASTQRGAQGPLSSYGPVQPGETLWKIARNIGSANGGSARAIMAALVEANPQAFIGGDMNRLLAGAVLRIPAALGGASPQPRRGAAVAVSASPATAGTASPAARPAAVATATAPRAARAATADTTTVRRKTDWRENKPELARKLADMDAKFAALRARYGAAGPAATSVAPVTGTRDMAASEVSPVQTQAAAESMLAQAEASPPAARADAKAAPADAEQAAETPAASTPTEAEAAGAKSQAVPAVTAQPAPAVAAVAAPAAVSAPEMTAQGPGIGARLRMLAGLIPFKLLGYVALAGLALWAALRGAAGYRKRHRAVTAERVHHDLEAERRNEVARKARQRLELEAEVRRIIDDHEDTKARLREAGLQELTGADSEGMTEIDMSITHGRYQQAEKLLREVIHEAPRNTGARLRLAEVYYITERIDEFIAEVRELRDSHRQRISDSDWQKLLRMGKVVAPEDPLFGGLSSVPAEPGRA